MKTEKQKKAWRLLIALTHDPKWYKDPVKVKKHKVLMEELEMPVSQQKEESKKKAWDIQKYLDSKPGLEDEILELLKAKKTVNEMREIFPITLSVFSFVRSKYGLPTRKMDVPPKDELEAVYEEKGAAGVSEKWSVSHFTVYKWLDHHGIERLKVRKIGKNGQKRCL